MSNPNNYDNFQKNFQARQDKRKELLDKKYNKGGARKTFNKTSSLPPSWAMRMKYWRPTETSTRVRLIPHTQDQAFYEYHQTWIKVNNKSRTVLCNCKNGQLVLPDGAPIPCLPCEYAINDENTALLPNKKYTITVLVLEDFYKVTQMSKAGNEYFKYVRSLGSDRFGRSLDPEEHQDCEKVFGQVYHWSLGSGHRKQLVTQLEKLTERCGNCKQGEISTWGYECPNCQHLLGDHKESPISIEEEEKLQNEQIKCPSCEATVCAEELIECVLQTGSGANVKWEEGCTAPSQIDWWDLDLSISTTGTGNSTSLVIDATNWEIGDNTVLKEEWKLKPMNFDYFFRYQDLEDQARAMQRANLFNPKDQEDLENFFKMADTEDTTHADPY